ncbi:hypothetical protein [Natronorubrum sp. FCH18a]|uniref:hypothetical protein n=1 Tax=Natronorubrum sp. FCH18a TaxID=3447018 RepID=UPI003F50D7EE
MGSGSDNGRRLLAISAVCCAIFGLLLAASAMPMVASDSPASDFFDGDDREPGQPSTQAAQQLPGGIDADGESDDTDRTGGETSGGSAVMDAGGTPAASLANRAADFDNPIAEGVLYGLASLFAAFDGGSSVDPAGVGGSEDADPTAGTDESGDGDFAESGVGGEFGDALTADDLEDEYDGDDGMEAADEDGAEPEREEVGSNGGDRTVDGDADGDGDPEDGGERWEGDDTDSGETDETESDEWGSGTADGDGSTGGTDGTDGESNEPVDGEDETGDEDSGSGDGNAETDSGDETGDAETESADDDADWGDDETAAETEMDDSSGERAETADSSDDTDGTDDSSDDADDETAAGEDSGGDDSGLTDSVPGLSDGVVTTALVAVAVLVVAYVFYTRENPIGTLLSIPGRIVSLALAGVVACSQALERAVSALRGLRSIAELPRLVLTTLEDAFRSAGTRVRTVRRSLFGGGDGATGGTDAEIRVTARERIRRAFESVIDASPMYRGRVATVTPTEVARSARDAGAPAEPVETITDSFRDVEYGERDPESYFERTTTAHERLRAELEADAETADEPGGSGATDE